MLIKGAIVAMAIVLGTPAFPQPNHAETEAATERVAYVDLDLGSQAGEAALLRRIRAASSRVCDVGGMQTMDDFSLWGRCYRSAVAHGSYQMRQVLAAHNSRAMITASAIVVSGVTGK